MLSTSFIFIFVEYLKRFSSNKKNLILLNYKDSLISKDLMISIKYFTIFVYKLLNNNLFYNLHFYNVNYNDLFLKDYNLYYILEYFFSLNKFFYKKSCFFIFENNIKFFLYRDFFFRIDFINFFSLGNYIEFLRLFLYNEYINNLLYKNNKLFIKKFIKRKFLTRSSLQNEFKNNLLYQKYVIYFYDIKLQNKNILFHFLPKFKSLLVNRYLKYVYVFQVRLFLLFFIIFFDFLRLYEIFKSYISLNYFPDLFFLFNKFRMTSIQKLYSFLRIWKMDFSFYFFYDLFYNLQKSINLSFLNVNLNIFLKNNNNLLFVYNFVDLTIISYISKLYFYFLDNFNFSSHLDSTVDFTTIWEVLEDWYHFDFILIPNIYSSIDMYLNWLSVFKYNLDFFLWSIYNGTFISEYNIFNSNMIFYKFLNIFEYKIQFFYMTFSEILFQFLNKIDCYIFFDLRLLYIFDFLIDFFFKYNLLCLEYLEYNKLYILRLKQYKYFCFRNILFKRYNMFYNNTIKYIN